MQEVVKSIARPTISILFAVVLCVLVLQGITAPEWFLALAIPVVSWWFVERAVTHVQENRSATVDKIADKLSEKVIAGIYQKTNSGHP